MRRYEKAAAATVLGLSIFVGPLRAEPPEAVLLRYGPTGEVPVVYRQETETITRINGAQGFSARNYTSKKQIARRLTSRSDGLLELEIVDGEGEFEVDGKTVEKDPVGGAVSQARMVVSSTGEPVAGALQVSGSAGGSGFVLPERTVSMGDTWETVTPPSDEFPLERKLVFTLTGFKESSGRRFAIIASASAIKKEVPERFCAVDFEHSGTHAFDVESGQLAQSSSKTRMKIRFLAANKAGLADTETETTRRLKRVN